MSEDAELAQELNLMDEISHHVIDIQKVEAIE